jgi:hypothetical protein
MSRRLPVFFVGDQLIGLGTGFFDELGQRLDLFLCGKDGGGVVEEIGFHWSKRWRTLRA